MENLYLLKNQKKLRWGYTTGTCAAAASMAAAAMLLGGKRLEQVTVKTPKGVTLQLEVEEICMQPGRVCCAVRKDGGDDPDVTDGLLIWSAVSQASPEDGGSGDYREDDGPICLLLCGGAGVGHVTKAGLACEVGKPAINPVPRRMIFDHVLRVCRAAGFAGALRIEISVPGGEETACRTFNPQLGILGGISILGTSGLVEPMSEAALVETIRLDLRQKRLEGESPLLVVPGNYGSAFLADKLGLDPARAVKCSNFIGATLDMAVEEGAESLLLVGHGGKLIKLAAGIMNTHSSSADGRMEILAAHAGACGAGAGLIEDVLQAVTVDRALALLEDAGLQKRVMERVMERIDFYLKRRAGGRLAVEALVFTNERGLLGQTPGAGRLLRQLQAARRKGES